jgi:tetratricopeptide (TPR) repeat protein
MRSIRILVISYGLLFLTACAGVGIVASSDPLTKLNDAEDLFMRQDRPLPAEQLIREAMAIYQERNDPQGLGHAHREYADLLQSRSITGKWQNHYRSNGFLDKSVTFENRIAKSSEHYFKALEYYALAETKLREESRFDALTNVYLNMAYSSSQLDDRDKACVFYNKGLEAYTENIRRTPGAKPYGGVPEFVASEKKRLGCA